MTYLLDTNAWVAYLRGKDAGLVQRLRQADPQGVALCTVVLAEVVHGAYKSGPAHCASNLSLIAQLRHKFPCLPFDEPAADWWNASIRVDRVE